MIILLSIPLFIVGSLFKQSVDVATVKVNQFTFNAYANAVVESVNVREGESVYAHQLLITLSSAELNSQLLVINNNIVLLKKLHVQETISLAKMYKSATDAINIQLNSLEKYQKYKSSGIVSLIMMDSQIQNYNTARANLDSIKTNMINSNVQYQQNLSALTLKHAEVAQQIKSLQIYSLESGVVSHIAVTKGQTVNPASNLVTIDSGYKIIVRTNKLLNKYVHIKVENHFIKCITTNISNQERDFSILNSNSDKSIYLLSCPKLPPKYIVDGFSFYVW